MIIRLQSLTLALWAIAAFLPAQETSTSRPNILIILTDDMGYGDVTCNGPGAGVQTRNIDRLAKQGVRFTQYYAPSPLCSPSRAGMLTGRFPGRLRLNTYLQARVGNVNCEQDDWLDPAIPTLPRLLKSAGYATAHVGKWHLGGGRDVTTAPKFAAYGYDEGTGTWESPEPHSALGRKYPPWEQREEPGQVPRYRRTEYMVDRTLDFMQRHSDQPWFITLWPDDVHTPHRPSPEMAAKYGGNTDGTKTPRKNFQGVLEEYDRQIGRLMDGVTSMGLEQNTIVIFTSDNGPEPPFGTERTAGLRGIKMSLYEGGVREPFLVRWPGHIVPGTVNESTVLCAIDLFPTLCNMAGVAIPQEIAKEFDGEQLSASLLGETPARQKTLYWEYGRKPDGFYKYPGRPIDRSPNVAARKNNLKVLVNADGTGREAYDIQSNSQESTAGLLSRSPEIDGLTSAALEWRKVLPPRQEYSY
ncbi:MAG: sulfatase-like hydrolase/transferase [Candidatus Sumerlaeaceae bacterium]